MTRLDERYRDVLLAPVDAETLRVVEDLDKVCANSAPPPPHLCASMDRALQEQMSELSRRQATAHRNRRLPWTRRPTILVAALLAAMIIAGGVYAAVVTLGDQALAQSPSTRPIVQHNLGRTLNLTRGACGYTMMLNRVYADPQQIIIGYTDAGPSGRKASPGLGGYDWHNEPILTDSQGHRYPSMGQTASHALIGNASGQVMRFDASKLAHLPRALKLRFTMPVIAMNIKHDGRELATARCARYSRTDGRARTFTVKGPFVYDFTVPVAPMRTVDLHQAVRAHGVTVTLTRVKITRINMWVSLHYVLTSAAPLDLLPLTSQEPKLAVPASLRHASSYTYTISRHGQAYYIGFPSSGNGTPSGYDMLYEFAAPFYGYHGKETLVVFTHVVEKPLRQRIEETVLVKGRPVTKFIVGGFSTAFTDPVTIHFTVP